MEFKPQKIGLLTRTTLVIGSMIGTGDFVLPTGLILRKY